MLLHHEAHWYTPCAHTVCVVQGSDEGLEGATFMACRGSALPNIIIYLPICSWSSVLALFNANAACRVPVGGLGMT